MKKMIATPLKKEAQVVLDKVDVLVTKFQEALKTLKTEENIVALLKVLKESNIRDISIAFNDNYGYGISNEDLMSIIANYVLIKLQPNDGEVKFDDIGFPIYPIEKEDSLDAAIAMKEDIADDMANLEVSTISGEELNIQEETEPKPVVVEKEEHDYLEAKTLFLNVFELPEELYKLLFNNIIREHVNRYGKIKMSEEYMEVKTPVTTATGTGVVDTEVETGTPKDRHRRRRTPHNKQKSHSNGAVSSKRIIRNRNAIKSLGLGDE